MDMLGHHYITHHGELIFFTDLIEDFQELVTVSRAAQEWKPAVAAAGDEVQMLMSVTPLRLFVHDAEYLPG